MNLPKLVGVLNITPNSFSQDGLSSMGDWLPLLKERFSSGADYVDIGAEATSPGSEPITSEEELQRLAPIFKTISTQISVEEQACFSCDTRKAVVAEQAIQAGFGMINDVSGGRADPNMFPLIANSQANYVLMYAKNASGFADLLDNQDKVFEQLCAFWDTQINKAYQAGIRVSQLILDPGMSTFISVRPEDSIEIISRLSELKSRYQLPLFIGVSRKSFLGKLSAYAPDAKERLGASLAAAYVAAQNGADYLRVHDIRATRQFFDVLGAMQNR